jgi:transcriptional regulator with XRE-family HTH domain
VAHTNKHPLRAYRRRKKLSQKILAERAGTTKGHISQIETGVLEPGLTLLRRLIIATNHEVTCDDILWWDHPRS